eukprot:snap_masked-scaffold1224_size54636-processed-gene-0.6 protein:Tk04423 transcript:snap_masked-scaffold1224_size54636-processed-gene-0.6-mRNA-1 annotation:"probable proline dehydrogenase 2"
MRGASGWLGPRSLAFFLRPTFYGQFVGGDSETELVSTATKLQDSGLRLMVCPVQEEDAGELDSLNEIKYDQNRDFIMETGRIMARSGTSVPNLQFKVTAFMPADLVVKMSNLIVDGYHPMEALVEQLAKIVNPKSQSGNFEPGLAGLSDAEWGQLERGLMRVSALGQLAQQAGLKLLVDAEYTYMNPGISAVALAMMMQFNTQDATVSNTYQCYLKAALNTITKEKKLVTARGRHFGAKIVRGAYMEKERKIAEQKGLESPVCDDYEATNQMYNQVLDHMVEYAQQNRAGYLVVASHNEESVRRASDLIAAECPQANVVFGQIYGMGEQISMPLARAGHIVYKSVPYGPLEEVLPYLSRRAAENRVVLSGARKEQALLKAELKRRWLSGLRPRHGLR